MLPPPPRSTLFPYTTLFRSARGMGKCAVVGARDMHVDLQKRQFTVGDVTISEGDYITVDGARDRKSTRLNSSHMSISYAVFCLKKKKKQKTNNIYRHKKSIH